MNKPDDTKNDSTTLLDIDCAMCAAQYEAFILSNHCRTIFCTDCFSNHGCPAPPNQE